MAPVTNEARSRSSQAATSATSRGSAMRPSGIEAVGQLYDVGRKAGIFQAQGELLLRAVLDDFAWLDVLDVSGDFLFISPGCDLLLGENRLDVWFGCLGGGRLSQSWCGFQPE